MLAGALLTIVLGGCARTRPPARIVVFTYSNAFDLVREELGADTSLVVFEKAPVVSERLVTLHLAEQFAARPEVTAVVGYFDSRTALMAAPVHNAAGLPQLVPTATSRQLRAAGPYTFMLAPDDSAEGEFIAGFVAERLGARSATVFYTADEYGFGLRSGVTEALRARGVDVVDEVLFGRPACAPSARGPSDGRVVASLRRAVPAVIVLAVRTDEATCVIRSAHPLTPGATYVAGDGVVLAGLRGLIWPAPQRLFAVSQWNPASDDSLAQAFVQRFRQRRLRDPNPADALEYDAASLLVQAVREVGPDRERVSHYLRELGSARPPYRGVTGPIAFVRGARRPLAMLRFEPRGPFPVVP